MADPFVAVLLLFVLTTLLAGGVWVAVARWAARGAVYTMDRWTDCRACAAVVACSSPGLV